MKTGTPITTFLNSILAEIILTQPKGACSDLYKILCTLLNDGYAKNVYNNRHCSTSHGQFSHFFSI